MMSFYFQQFFAPIRQLADEIAENQSSL